MRKVEVSKGLLIGLAVLTAAAVLGLVFLLGRESGRQKTMPDPVAMAVSPRSGAAIPQASTTPMPLAAQPFAQPQPGAIPVPPAEPVTDAMRTAVAAYFNAMGHIQAGGMAEGPEGAAQGIVGSLMKGDSSGFDQMIQQAESARASLAAITPPQPCAAYHRESLETLDEGFSLMRSLKTALAAPDGASQVSALTAQANDLRARSEALQSEEQALRQRYGVPAKP
ncbi:MAG TPA: hypothetical protein VL181_01575 [Holophagaceae bacterium]|nr:hypothetical protein [Holophagaceae bacterium]